MAVEMASQIGASILADVVRLQDQASGLGVPSFNALGAESSQAEGGFADTMKQALLAVNEQDRAAGERMADVDSGRSDDLVGAMLASQEASLSFSMLMQVRNKVVGAMDDLIKLQL